MTALHPLRSGPWPLSAALLAAGVFLLVLGAPNDMTDGDARGCLLSAHALIHDGSLDLTPWPQVADPADYRFQAGERGVHYFLGFGTAFLAVPAVFVAELAGLDVTEPDDDRRLQRWLAAAVVAGLFLIAWRLFLLVAPPPAALALALAFTLGSSLASTLGTALWNLGPATLALAAAAFLAARHDRGGALQPVLLGALLGAAFLIRPSSLLPLLLGVLYVVWRARPRLPRLLLGLLPWLVFWLFVNRRELGVWLPDYYRALGQSQQWAFTYALRGQLLSPGRGLLVFTPFVAPLLLWVLLRGRRQPAALLGLGGILWFALHAVSIARHAHWWGGTCFGPRLATDALPALLLVALAAVADWRTWRRPALRWTVAGGCALLAVIAVWIHTAQGLYNPATEAWNRRPSVETHVSGIFDWRWPQFLASEARNAERDLVLRAHGLRFLPPGVTASAASPQLLFSDWNALEGGPGTGWWRWSRGERSYLALRLDPKGPAPRKLLLDVGAFGHRTATVLWNGIELGAFTGDGFGPHEVVLPVPEGVRERSPLSGGRQLLELRLSDPAPRTENARELGIHLMGLRWAS